MISQHYSDLPCFLCQEPSLLLEPLLALALPLVLLVVVLLLPFFSFFYEKASVISAAAFNFSATAISFADDFFDGLIYLPGLSFFSTSLSQLCTLCLKEKISDQYLQTIACLYTGHQYFLAPHEFQQTF